jgi:hypothetical protein
MPFDWIEVNTMRVSGWYQREATQKSFFIPFADANGTDLILRSDLCPGMGVD